MTLLIFTESQEERPENSAAIAALVQQDRASRNDAEYARRNRNKAASKRVPANAAKYIGYRFSDDEFGANVIFEIKDVYFTMTLRRTSLLILRESPSTIP